MNEQVEIEPGQDIQAYVRVSPAGTTFVLRPGIYRNQTISPKDGDTIAGQPGTVLSGARLLTMFEREGGRWVGAGPRLKGDSHGECEPRYPRCGVAEQLFVDDQPVPRVETLNELTAGTWYYDRATGRVCLGDDPAGHRVEVSVTGTAIEPTGDRVTVSGLVVEKYANQAQQGAISSEGRTGWVIARNEVRWNHGAGVRADRETHVIDNEIHHNGQLGISATGSAVLVESNEIAYNNTAHFDAGWEAGGAKFVRTDGLIVRGNRVHHNDGPGLWTDTDNTGTLYESNLVEDNARMGIFHEISYDAVIRGNVVRRNGFGFRAWMWGAGILVAGSPDVEIYDNTVEDNANGIAAVQQRRGSGARGPYEISNLWVHDNAVTMQEGKTGLAEDVGDPSYYTARNNRFDRNRYRLGASGDHFAWMDKEQSETAWRSHGQDRNGTFSRQP